MPQKNKSVAQRIRKWSRPVHRYLSFFFAGIIVIYAISGIALNHKANFNSDYDISRKEIILNGIFPKDLEITKEDAFVFLQQVGEPEKNYTKHYRFSENQIKIFLKEGSSLEVDTNTGKAIYERVRKRPILNTFNRLHYNPSHYWTWFSDIFALSLLVITITGIVMMKGKKGLIGWGGILLIAGILFPIIIFLLLP